MKDYKSLAGAVIRIAIMIGGGLWFNNPTNDNGGFGLVVLVLPMTAINIVLFIGAVIRFGDFFRSLRWDDHLKEVDPPD